MRLENLRDKLNEAQKEFKRAYDALLNVIDHSQYAKYVQGKNIQDIHTPLRTLKPYVDSLKKTHRIYQNLNALYELLENSYDFNLDAEINILFFKGGGAA